MARPLIAALVPALTAAALLTGCDLGVACPGIYRFQGLTLEVDRSPGETEWTLTFVEPDGATCIATVTEGRSPTADGCGGYIELMPHEGGAAIHFGGYYPDRAELSITSDDMTLFDGIIDPAYRTDAPDGEACGEVTLATVTIDLAGP